jgi:thiamine pyrophosphate-dependent acetolactate synthase large subunit-like protein
VQIDIDASMLSLRYPAEVSLHGDAAATLRRLLPMVTLKQARGFVSSMIKGDASSGHVVKNTARQVLSGLFGDKQKAE